MPPKRPPRKRAKVYDYDCANNDEGEFSGTRQATEHFEHTSYHTTRDGTLTINSEFLAIQHNAGSDILDGLYQIDDAEGDIGYGDGGGSFFDDGSFAAQSYDTNECPEADDERNQQTTFPLEVPRRRRYASDRPLLMWIPQRSAFLDEFIRHEGRGDYLEDLGCYHCKEEPGVYRCDDCFGRELYCRDCIVKCHASMPLHFIKHWNDLFFEATCLKSLGLRVQLGHTPGQRCIRPKPVDDFVVIESNGIHEVGLDFCGCEMAQSHVKQLLRARLFPATVRDPHTAATFGVLEQFHLLSFESKASAYEFYHALKRRSDNTGLFEPKDRYEAFMRMIREWRNLKVLKRSGRGHDPLGIENTQPGGCAVMCPACPQPGMNLPEHWETESALLSWLYMVFLAIDANFRLKRKNVSSDEADPALGSGWAYFVEEREYKSYLAARVSDVQEKSTCSGHTAVNLADTKASRGLAATGVGTVDCSRHGFKLPHGVGDLQKGEKYVNMDYLFFSALRNYPVKAFFVSYDIACQWSKKLWARMLTMPPSLQFDGAGKVMDFGVPKFHLPAHKEPCQTLYSLNFLPFVGRTDGEAPERGWANVNPVASSSKEMGPGSRRDTLDDFFGDWNWKKVAGMGRVLLKKMEEAVDQRLEHEIMHHDFEAALDVDAVSSWTALVEAWEASRDQPNPYERKGEVMTQVKVRLELAKDEAQELQNGNDVSIHAEISPSILISTGLDLEDQQRRLAADIAAAGSGATDLQQAKLQHRTNILQRRLEQWSSVQVLYMPLVARRRGGDGNDSTDSAAAELQPQTYKLWLPSEGPELSSVLLLNDEWRLRYAQGFDALEELRQFLRLRSYLLDFKKNNIRGQGSNTRARNTLKGVEAKIQGSAAKYRTAHTALKALGRSLRKVGWERTLQVLKDEDLRGLSVGEDGQSEGRRTMSWIWQTTGVSGNENTDLQESLRIEWCKSRARARRWSEEVVLLKEEMRRVQAFFASKARWWRECALKRDDTREDLREGLGAYAARQAALYHALRLACKVDWINVPKRIQEGEEKRLQHIGAGTDTVDETS
ncbi:hypothetical protein HYDPIDRAFT_116748 [Hydnomerulius pinastri MD-312]|uniref:CxC2-like cysteine cluster KDZ transposase-associated domain-containing protein n=1 Tax=Hydnomerulius pinastri MD-312 TaxID=994086 RepID=A0A0C9WBJ1_9AGAM|nr:hypothetical protein HYDPIDRAFT_116748 [Hydnomerulius pinastri MD-312]